MSLRPDANAMRQDRPIALPYATDDNTVDAGLYKLSSLGDYVWGGQELQRPAGRRGVRHLRGHGEAARWRGRLCGHHDHRRHRLLPLHRSGSRATTRSSSRTPAAATSSPDRTSAAMSPTSRQRERQDRADRSALRHGRQHRRRGVCTSYRRLAITCGRTRTTTASRTAEVRASPGSRRALDGVRQATTTTDGTGFYHFTDLQSGNYQVEFANPGGGCLTGQDIGSDVTDLTPTRERCKDRADRSALRHGRQHRRGSVQAIVDWRHVWEDKNPTASRRRGVRHPGSR